MKRLLIWLKVINNQTTMTKCQKYTYVTKSDAKKKKKQIEWNQKQKLYIYKCKVKGCRFWHMSTKKPEFFRTLFKLYKK